MIKNKKYEGYVNDPDGYGKGGYRIEFVEIVAPNIKKAKSLLNMYVKKNYRSSFEGKLFRIKASFDNRVQGVYSEK